MLTIAPRTVPDQLEFVGQAEASRRVEVRAQVSGVIQARPYVEGSDVPKGALLFRLDPTPYEAAYRSAQAQLADARARLANADRNLARLRPLLADHAVAQKDVDDAQTADDQARAAVQSAEADVDRTRKDYENTFVRAEIAGRAGRALMVVGSLVKGSSDLLTTIDQLDPIYVNFNPSDQDVMRWREDLATHRLVEMPGGMKVRAVLADGAVLPMIGRLNFEDVAIQPGTGTLPLRAELPNAKHALLPGQFVRVRLTGLQRTGVILVPQRAVQQGLGGAFVYVVDSTGNAAVRPVSAGPWQGDDWIIEDGLAAGDRVVIDGVQKVRPGAAVRTVPYSPPADTALGARVDSGGPRGGAR